MVEPQIISIVSGKGGVGKTMLSVAIANELARSKKTLLLDLDFFNRGLTGLFASAKATSHPEPLTPPGFFGDSDVDWSVGEVERNFFMVFYGDLDKSQSDILEVHDVRLLAGELSAFIRQVTEKLQCEFVVLDCHGGPDNTSFAACSIATRSIVVSEPDRITLHGTLNFLRILRRQTGNKPLDIRLVFNKVVAGFTSMFLFNFYNDYLRSQFGDRDLLAIYPLEIYLTKAFEKIPYLTTVYPTSQLAIKSRLVLFELFQSEGAAILPPQIADMTSIERFKSKYYMGRRPKLLDLDFVLKAIAVYALVVIGLPISLAYVWDENKFPVVHKLVETLVPLAYAMVAAVPWVIAVIVVEWTIELDTWMTYSFRTRAFTKSVIAALILMVFWLPAAAGLGGILHELSPLQLGTDKLMKAWQLGAFVVLAVVPLIIVGLYGRRGYRNIKFDNRYAEGIFRIAFSAAFVLLAIAYMIEGLDL
jgi:cellulose biosynthesis protein BcsQ